jgi:hypothetical protein
MEEERGGFSSGESHDRIGAEGSGEGASTLTTLINESDTRARSDGADSREGMSKGRVDERNKSAIGAVETNELAPEHSKSSPIRSMLPCS